MASDRPDLQSPRIIRATRDRTGTCNLQRPLGGIEVIYHHSTSQGVDMICLMTKIVSKYPVIPSNVEKALKALCRRHPMLRMTIQPSEYPLDDEFCFVEKADSELDYKVSSRRDWLEFLLEEVAIPIDIRHGPLWKCRMLGNSTCDISTLDHESRIVPGKTAPEYESNPPIVAAKDFRYPDSFSSNNKPRIDHNTNPETTNTQRVPSEEVQDCSRRVDQPCNEMNCKSSAIHTDTCRARGSASICKSNGQAMPTSNQTDDQHFKHEATFIFVWHHAIMDGGYVLWTFRDFVHLLDNYTLGVPTNAVPFLPLLPPMEHALQFPTVFPADNHPADNPTASCNISLCRSNPSDRIIRDYNATFASYITVLRTAVKNKCSVFRFSERDSELFRRNCASAGASPTGAIVAASLLGLVEVIYGSTDRAPPDYEIPFEVMLDLRRFCPIDAIGDTVEHFPGVSSIDIPLKANIRRRDKSLNVGDFWKIAKSFGVAVQRHIKSKEAFDWIHSVADANSSSARSGRRQLGKSPFVVCISNMGRCDGVLGEEVEQRMRITDLHGHSSILVDDMPLFFVTTFSLNGRFCGNVSYCENYTSPQTATKYIGNIHKHLLSQSNL